MIEMISTRDNSVWQSLNLDSDRDVDIKSKIELVLERHYNDFEFSHQEFCRYLKIGRTSLHYNIKLHFRMSTTALINDFRLKKAEALLVETLMPIGSLANRVGYKDSRYFSRLFSRKYNVGPLEYRHRNKDPDSG